MIEQFTVIWPLVDSVESGGWLDVYDGDSGPYEHAGRDRIKREGLTLGAEVIACQAGVATVNHEGDGWGNGSFGSCVRIDHPQGDGSYWSIVAHLQRDSVAVKTGDTVRQGQPLGLVGMTGKTNGPHTHFAIQSGGGGSFDPARYLFGGVWKVGNKQLVDPARFIVQPATPVDVLALAQAAYDNAVELNRAIMLRGAINAIAYGDLALVEQAAAALRKAGFKL